MAYLKFNKDELVNLEYSLKREVLATNRAGASLIIPCHRVVGSHGSLTGYAGGIDKKAKLLALEQVDMSAFFIPKTGTALYNR